MKPVLELNQLCVSLKGRKKTKDLVKGISCNGAFRQKFSGFRERKIPRG